MAIDNAWTILIVHSPENPQNYVHLLKEKSVNPSQQCRWGCRNLDQFIQLFFIENPLKITKTYALWNRLMPLPADTFRAFACEKFILYIHCQHKIDKEFIPYGLLTVQLQGPKTSQLYSPFILQMFIFSYNSSFLFPQIISKFLNIILMNNNRVVMISITYFH